MTAPSAPGAPYNDIQLLNSLINYSTIHPVIVKVASEKLSNHFWDLSEDLIGLALFDSRVSVSTKRLMVKAMREVDGVEEPPKRVVITLKNFKDKKLEDFVSKRSILFMEKLKLSRGFLQVDPEMWEAHDDFTTSLEIIQTMKVVNEGGVASADCSFETRTNCSFCSKSLRNTIERFQTAGSRLWLDSVDLRDQFKLNLLT